MSEMLEWFEEYPTESGMYWFYGDPWWGTMGCHYYEGATPDKKMYLVSIRGTFGSCDGQIFYNRKFDGKRAGYVGKFAKAILPHPPE